MLKGARSNKEYIRRENIQFSDSELLRRYLDIDRVPCRIQSPIRPDDDCPSFSFFERGGHIFWKDFGTGETGSLISLFSRLWCTEREETLRQIYNDCRSIPTQFALQRKHSGIIKYTSGSDLKVKVREWKSWDVEYWKSFGIDIDTCKRCNVYPVSHVFFCDGNSQSCIAADKYAYAYFEWKDGKESIKLYQPFSKKMKWISKHDQSVWDLWNQAFEHADKCSNESVILTSSRKDAMCLWCTLNVPAMSLQGEGYIPKKQVMEQVLDRFRHVYIWYDNDFKHKNDNPGQDNAKKLIGMFPRLINICIPTAYNSKDPSDLCRDWGADAVVSVWNTFKQP